jgi:hypothetical protein
MTKEKYEEIKAIIERYDEAGTQLQKTKQMLIYSCDMLKNAPKELTPFQNMLRAILSAAVEIEEQRLRDMCFHEKDVAIKGLSLKELSEVKG